MPSSTLIDALLASRPDNVSLVNAGTIQEGNTFYCIPNIDDVDLLLNLNKRPDVY